MRRADDSHVKLVRKIEIGDESAGASHQGHVFQPCDRHADMAAPRPSGLHGFRVHNAQSPAASAFQFDLAGIDTDRKSALKRKGNQKKLPLKRSYHFFNISQKIYHSRLIYGPARWRAATFAALRPM
jgi:hypothetical protein